MWKEKIVLTLSNFAPRKGIIEYLNVIEKVINVDSSIKFIIAGRDDMRGKVQKEIKRKKLESFVNTPGFVNNTSCLLKSSKLHKRHMLIEKKSYEAMPELLKKGEENYDFIFIDGWHTFDYTLVDFFYSDKLF